DKPGGWVRYAGGYDDMVAQRGSAPGLEAARARQKAAKQAAPVEKPKPAAKTKLSYKEQFALEKLPAEIDALQKDIAALKAKLHDPNLFARDAALFDKTAKAL